MGFLSRLFGNEERAPQAARADAAPGRTDAQAIERYRYMMRTAPPETIEQAHREAFGQLTPEQRRQVLSELARAAPPHERAAIEATSANDPSAMARAATRAELRQPGMMERTLGGAGLGLGSSVLTSFAAGFVGSLVAQSFFSSLHDDGGGDQDSADDQHADDRHEGDDATTHHGADATQEDDLDVDQGAFEGDEGGLDDFDV